MEEIYKITLQRRTIRRFKQKGIPLLIQKKLINSARLAPSAANLQPLEYILVRSKKLCNEVFKCLRWAGYIHPEGIPPLGKRPSCYIVVLVNMRKAKKEFFAYDVGASVENILLVAWSYSIGCCWMQSIERKKLRKILKVPSHLRIDSVIALGYRDEAPKIEPFKNSVRYWKDKKGVLHVPKRKLSDILHFDYYKK